MLFRRGPATGNRLVPAGSFQFSRTERARLEFPASPDAKPGSGRLLDQSGEPLAVPVTMGERTDEQKGQHWITADITLAPLGAGDYVVELTADGGGPAEDHDRDTRDALRLAAVAAELITGPSTHRH